MAKLISRWWQAAVMVGLGVLVIALLTGWSPLSRGRETARTPTPEATVPWPTEIPTRVPTATAAREVAQARSQGAVSSPTPRPTATPKPTWTPTPTRTPTPTPTYSPTPRVTLLSVRALGRLETVQFPMQVVVDRTRTPNGWWERLMARIKAKERLQLVAGGEVTAGVDLSDLRLSDVVVAGDSVLIWLPKAQLLSVRVDNATTYVLDEETSLLVGHDRQFEGEVRRVAEQQLADWALSHGILQTASEHAEVEMERLLLMLGFDEIRVYSKTF